MIEKRQCRADQPNKQGKGYFVEAERERERERESREPSLSRESLSSCKGI